MKPDAASAATATRVAARIREEMANIDQVMALIEETLAQQPPEPAPPVVTIHGLGGLLHDFYTGTENVFGQVAPQLNGQFLAGDSWHRELLHTMTLDLPGIRPPVIMAGSEQRLVEYLKFRRVYRHMYGFRLHWHRVRQLATAAIPLWRSIREELEAFVAYLDEISRALMGPDPSGRPDGQKV